jgi:Protein of unknown function (DUF3991)
MENVAYNRCGYVVDEEESCRTSVVMRYQGSKIIVATARDGHGIFFEVHGDCEGGSVIDFIQWRNGGKFKFTLGDVRKALRDWLHIPRLSFPVTHRAFSKPEPMSRDREGLFTQWYRMQPYKSGYLEGRGLNPRTLGKFAEQIRTDHYGNACFRHDDENGLSGWEVKNKGWTGFAGGGKKALFCCQVSEQLETPPPVIVVAEGAIDALSYYQLNPSDGLYISFAGGLSPEQKQHQL